MRKHTMFYFFVFFLKTSFSMAQDINPWCYGLVMPPLCGGEHIRKSIAIDNCNKNAKSLYIKHYKDFLVAQNPRKAGQLYGPGYTAIKILKENKDTIVAIIAQNFGGTGDFSSIVLFEKKDGRLVFRKKLVEGGDRCWRGISDAKFILKFSVKITAREFLELFQENTSKITKFYDFNDCATCCFAKAHYEMEKLDYSEAVLTGVTFTDITKQNNNKGVRQNCLIDLMKKYGCTVGKKYRVEELLPLIVEVKKSCLI